MYSVHWGINLPSKTPPALSCQAPPLKSSNCPRHPILGNLPYFLVERLPPSPQKSHSLFPSNPPVKTEVLSSPPPPPPPFGKFGRRFNRSIRNEGGAHYVMCVQML